jgi:hypothetical protein
VQAQIAQVMDKREARNILASISWRPVDLRSDMALA